ncbi:MAG: glutamate-5-semialdehyde dehydrogenase [Candidatus Woesearchaeota archaeon]
MTNKTQTVKAAVGKVKQASLQLAAVSTLDKNKALKNIIEKLNEKKDEIFLENNNDIEAAKKENISEVLISRLLLDYKKFNDLIKGLKDLINLEDPVGKIISELEMDKDLILKQVACPIGVIGVIFEARPEALVQIASLCLKSGNAVVLKGGSEAIRSNKILFEIFVEGSKGILPDNWIYLLESREEVQEILKLDCYIDLLIPRGSNKFVKFIKDNTKIPVLGHADGICHIYVDKEADLEMAEKIVIDAKCQYPAVCNAVETLLVHKSLVKSFLPVMKKELENHGVKIKEGAKGIEYNDLIISINVVDSFAEAVEHINTYSSGHTEAIITQNKEKAEKFMREVDASSVMWNCSTRFSDGYRFGKGAEVGVSTNKIHARGPVGMEGLLIYKYKLYGNGQIVKDYVEGRSKFTHKLRK